MTVKELKPVKNVKPIVVEQMEDILERAKTGEIQGVIYVCVFDDGGVGAGCCGLKQVDTPKLLGEIFLHASRMNIDEEGVDAEDIIY